MDIVFISETTLVSHSFCAVPALRQRRQLCVGPDLMATESYIHSILSDPIVYYDIKNPGILERSGFESCLF